MTVGLLLDYRNLILPNKEKLTGFLGGINLNSFYPSFFEERSGIVIVISETDFRSLDALSFEQKISQLNSLKVLSHAGVSYSAKKGAIVLGPIQEKSNLKEILEALLTYLPNTDWIWTATKGDYEPYVAQGFKHPFVADETPLGDKIPHALALVRKNDHQTKVELEEVYDEILYTLSPGTTCTFNFRVVEDARAYLRTLASKAGMTLNKNKTITQKEVSGGLSIESTETRNAVIFFLLGLDRNSTVYNKEEEASISPSFYNFHTHPQQAYIKHNVKLGWPSADDYSAFLRSVEENHTIFHLLAAVEGFYILSLSPYWAINLDDLDASPKWFAQNMHLREKEGAGGWEVKDYLARANGADYKGHPVFQVQFSEWDKMKPFEVAYPRRDGNCFYSKNTWDIYRKLYDS